VAHLPAQWCLRCGHLSTIRCPALTGPTLPPPAECLPIPSDISIHRYNFTQPVLPFQPNLLHSFEQSCLPINLRAGRKLDSNDWKLEDTPRVNLFPNLWRWKSYHQPVKKTYKGNCDVSMTSTNMNNTWHPSSTKFILSTPWEILPNGSIMWFARDKITWWM